MWRRAFAEALGTGLLVAVVVGSGVAAQRLSPDDLGLQLLENSLATTLGLAVLIAVLGPVSGAHLNPVVTAVDWFTGRRAAYWFTSSTSFANPAVTVGRMFTDTFAGISPGSVLPFVAAQVAGGVLGVLITAALYRPKEAP
ncbi:aquaporin [Promicromonospora kroppenstedtii]|uniref:aquaporin n=1 Tax=Promicromonospora kroppenstedtii TaxID=440482 RepID=UPI000A005165|nr:aquaporin [Promicromonospora kroppenstedtii]